MKTFSSIGIVGMLTLVVLTAHTQVPANFRINPSSFFQGNVYAARHPLDPNIILVLARTNQTSPSFAGTGVFATLNGGVSWSGVDTVLRNVNVARPSIDRQGRFFSSHLLTNGIGTNFSTDNGLTWSPSYSITGAFSPDANSIGTDDAPSSPFFGRTYAIWTNFSGTFTNRIMISFTTDGGSSWSSASVVSPPPSSNHHHQGCDLACGPNGELYVVWANCTTNGQNSTEDSLGFAVSTNGGASWTSATNSADDMNGIRSSNFFTGIRGQGFPRLAIDRSGGPRNGWLYVVAAEKNLPPYAMDISDIVLHRSTDRGVTWTRARVNQDLSGNGKYQFLPSLVVDRGGVVHVLYYDSRNVATNDSTDIVLSRSGDGGTTWSDLQISEHRFRPNAVSGSYDGTSIVATSNYLVPFWCDDVTGNYQVWGARVQNPTTSALTDGFEPRKLTLEQNYPNPFNPKTEIRYQTSDAGRAIVSVSDVLGRAVATLVNEVKPAGSHSITFDAASLPSGVYFCHLQTENFAATRKMTLIK